MNSFSMVNASYAFNLIDVHDLCRICGNMNNTFTSIYEDDGNLLDISSKINEYLPITIRKTDFLPLKICSVCAHTLLTFHDLYIACQSTNARFMNMLGCEPQDPTYGYDAVKQITTDPTELLEIQSSFSREIENEIMQMHNAKYIENEIAADAAATELERIGGSFGEGSYVGVNENGGEDKEANNIVLMNLDHQIKLEVPSNGQRVELDETAKNKSKKSSGTTSNGLKKGGDVKQNMTEKSGNKEKSRNSRTEAIICGEEVPNGTENQKQLKKVNGGVENGKAETESRRELTKQKDSSQNSTDETPVKPNKKLETRQRNTNQQNGAIQPEETTPKQTDTIKKTGRNRKNTKNTQENTSEPVHEDNALETTKCEHCDDEFEDKSKLVEHQKNYHNDKFFLCEVCTEYVAISDLIAHMLNHALQVNNGTEASTTTPPPPVSVTSPTKTESTKCEATSPEVKNQNNDSSKENTQPKSKLPVACTECDRKFADRTGLRYHINHFHNKVKNYECDLCGRYFSCKRIITNHLLGVHLREKRLKCDQCPKKFSTDSALYMHRKVHNDVLMFTCQICERKFRSLTKLKVHITTHTKEKNYFCEICNKGFAIRNNLTKHMHTHSKSFDFKCHKCDYAANQRRYLFEHIKRSHKV